MPTASHTTLAVHLILLATMANCERQTLAQSNTADDEPSLLDRAEVPYIHGGYRLAFAPRPENVTEGKWYVNDHCLLVDDSGTLHFFGINNPYPAQANQLYNYHPYMGHRTATADEPFDWQHQRWALDESQDTQYLGAPFIIEHDSIFNGTDYRYLMMFESRINNKRELELAYSNDLTTWRRTGRPVLHDLGLGATKRDPCIFKEGDTYYIYVNNPNPVYSYVALIKTKDFTTYSEPINVLGIRDGIRWGGLESPYVLKRNDLYYGFFCYAHRHYCETLVLVSDNPESFDIANMVTTLFTHAPEIVTYKGKTYISNCGPEDKAAANVHGLELAELRWLQQL